MLEESTGYLIGLNLRAFTTLLNFMNNDISTVFFIYKTCYGAGPALIIPYMPMKGSNPICYSFTIIAGASSDISTATGYYPSLLDISENFARTKQDFESNSLRSFFDGINKNPSNKSREFGSVVNNVLRFESRPNMAHGRINK